MRSRDADHLRLERALLKSQHLVNRLFIELLYRWTNARIWGALVLFWALLIYVRLLAATNDSFQVVLKDASLRHVTSYSSPRYLMFDVCGDTGDKLMALLDGLAYAFEANVSAVLPRARPSSDRAQSDWSLDDLIDVDYLVKHLAANITIHRQTPVTLPRVVAQTQRVDLAQVPPRQRAGSLREMFDVQQVVHLACPRWTFLWTLPYHALLRRHILLGLRPPKQMETLMSKLSLVRAEGYNCLAERLDDEWYRFCKDAETRTDNLRVMSWRECFITPRRLVDYVSHSDLARSKSLYISGHNATFATQVSRLGIKVHSSLAIVGDKSPSVPREMLDWYVCLSANISVVNSYESLGFLHRELRYLLHAGATEYYNQEPNFCPRLLCKEEQRRWYLDAALYATPEDQRRTWVSELKVNGMTVTGLLRVAKSCRFNFGIGWSCKTAPFTFSCSVDGKVHHAITASLVERPMSGDYEFSWKLPFTRPGRYVAHVWAHSEATKFEIDGSPVAFDVPGMNIYLYGTDVSHHCMRGLYHLHHEVLRRFGNVSYVFPKVEALSTSLTRAIDTFRETDLTNRDVLILTDMSFPQDVSQRLTNNGVKVVRWILEQPLDIVMELHNTGGLLPLCSSRHFMHQYACPPKAWVGMPISTRAVELSQRGTLCNRSSACPKRNLVLIDHNAQEQASTGISTEQVQAALGGLTELISFSEHTGNELLELYKRARVAVDLFMSGNEPLLLEASLFNVCPLVAFHGSARERSDFPLPLNYFIDSQNLTSTAATITRTLANCSSASLAPLKTEALAMHDRFPSQVATYFSDNVLFYIVCRTPEEEDWAVPTILALLINYPFADIEVVVRSEYFFRYDNAVLFEMLGRKSFAKSLTITQRNSVDRNHLLNADMFMISRPTARHLTTWIYQWPAGDIALSSELVQENVGLYEEAMEGSDRVTAVIRRVPAEADTAVMPAAPQFFFQHDLHFDLLAIAEARAAAEEKEAQAKQDSEAGDEKFDFDLPKQKPTDVPQMRSEAAAADLGFLLLQEQVSGTWRVGRKKTRSMCENWKQVEAHELWRSGATFLSDEVSRAMSHFAEACRDNDTDEGGGEDERDRILGRKAKKPSEASEEPVM